MTRKYCEGGHGRLGLSAGAICSCERERTWEDHHITIPPPAEDGEIREQAAGALRNLATNGDVCAEIARARPLRKQPLQTILP